MYLIPLDSFLKKSQLSASLSEIIASRIFKPRKDCETFFLGKPIDWEATDKTTDRNWRMQLQGWAIFFPIMNGFDASEIKQDLISFFFDIMTDWYQNYGQDPNDIVTTRMPKSFAWYDMSAGFRALVIAFFKNRLDYYNLYASDEQRHTLGLIIDKHISHLSTEKVFSLNNHGMFQIQGLMALIQVEDVSKYPNEYQYALKRMEELVRSQFDNKGVHLEHSPHYHFYALTVFQKIVINDWYDSKPVIKELIAKAISVKKWLVDPLKRTVCIGDSTLAIKKNINFKNKDFSSVLEIKTKEGVLSNFSESGYQIYRSDWEVDPKSCSYLFLMGMYNSKTHKHRDCLSFEWFEGGNKIICDSGKYGYVSDNYRSYFLSHRAHNTVEIDGFDILKKDPYGSCLFPAKTYSGLIEMSGELSCQEVVHHRRLVMKPGAWILVCDNLNYSSSKKTTQWFHPAPIYNDVSVENNRAVFKSASSELIINCLNKTLSSQVYFGDEVNNQGFISERDFSVEHSFAIGFSGVLEKLELQTILALSEEAEKDAINFLSKNGYDVMYSDREVVPKRILGDIINSDRTLYKRYDLLTGKYTYAYLFEGLRLNFYAHIKNDSNKLTIMLPGAVNRSKTIYNFQRHSWSEEISGSVISFLDPTVSEHNDITIGWFQGNKDIYAIPVLVSFIKTILDTNDIKEKDVTLLGSSAGGFSCLKIADSFPDSRIIVINPQTRVYNYFIKDYSEVVKWISPQLTPEQAKDLYYDRFTVSIDVDKRSRPIEYYQNTADSHHVQKHLDPLLNELRTDDYELVNGGNQDFITNRMLKIIYYSDKQSGHSPLSRLETIQILNQH